MILIFFMVHNLCNLIIFIIIIFGWEVATKQTGEDSKNKHEEKCEPGTAVRKHARSISPNADSPYLSATVFVIQGKIMNVLLIHTL